MKWVISPKAFVEDVLHKDYTGSLEFADTAAIYIDRQRPDYLREEWPSESFFIFWIISIFNAISRIYGG